MTLHRLLRDDDSTAFGHKVSAALNPGWALQGTPSCAEAGVKDKPGAASPGLKPGEQ